MNKRQLQDWIRTSTRLSALGFSTLEIASLRRIQMTLHRWQERECNGEIERDETTGKVHPYNHAAGRRAKYTVPDRKAGALRRLAKIMEGKKGVQAYVQGDPRGCALYIVRDSDVPRGGSIDAYYSRGIAVCI